MCATTDFIVRCAKAGHSRQSTRGMLGIGRRKFEAMLEFIPGLQWAPPGLSLAHIESYEARRGVSTPHLRRASSLARAQRQANCLYTTPDGASGTLGELLVRYGGTVTASTVRRRLAKGIDLMTALTSPPGRA